MASNRYTLNREDLGKIVKVVVYAGISAVIAALLNILPQVEIPTSVIWTVPLINAVLVALKKFFTTEA